MQSIPSSSRDNRLMAVTVEPEGRDLQIGVPRALFDARPVGSRAFFDVARDGMRFLVNTVRGESATPSITIVQGWDAALAP